MEETPTQIKLEYLEYMEEQGINKSDLPKELISKMTSIAMRMGKYEKSQSEKDANWIKQADILLADSIMDWQEGDYAEPTAEEEKPEAEEKPAEEEKPEAEEKPANDEEANNTLAQTIKSHMKGGKILKTELEKIIGKNVSGDIRIGKTTFRPYWLNSSYYCIP
jgi:hypothetical protein